MKKLLCLIPVFTLLCGCYPYTEVENMDILTSLYAEQEAEGILLGGGVANVRSFSDTMADNPVSLIRAEGADLEDAVTNLRRTADHELFFGALRAVVLGEDLATAGTDSILRYLDAQPRLRRSTAVFVTDSELESVVKYKAVNDFSAGFAADSIITTLYENGEMRYTSVGDILYALAYGDAGFSVPHIKIEDDVMRLDGYSLFTGGKMVGYTDNPSLIFFTMDNAAQQHLIDGEPVITRLKEKSIEPQFKNGALHVSAQFTFRLETGSGATTLETERKADEIRLLEEKVKTQIDAALAYSREIGCDYLELYKSRMAQSRTGFDMQNWNTLLRTMTYDVQVTVEN